jgi:hypothetical protein
MIKQYVEGLLDSERKRVETANLIEQYSKQKSTKNKAPVYVQMSPPNKLEPHTIFTSVESNNAQNVRFFTTASDEYNIATPKNAVSPSFILTNAVQPVHTTVGANYYNEVLTTRPFTNYAEDYQSKPLYSQTIPTQTVSPVAPPKIIYNSSSSTNLHAVSPAKQPIQGAHMGTPQSIKHTRSLSSKTLEPSQIGSERERPNSTVKFNYASNLGIGATNNINGTTINPLINPFSRSRTNSGLGTPLTATTGEQTNKDNFQNAGAWQKPTSYQPSPSSFFSQPNQTQNLNFTNTNTNTFGGVTTGFSNQSYTSGTSGNIYTNASNQSLTNLLTTTTTTTLNQPSNSNYIFNSSDNVNTPSFNTYNTSSASNTFSSSSSSWQYSKPLDTNIFTANNFGLNLNKSSQIESKTNQLIDPTTTNFSYTASSNYSPTIMNPYSYTPSSLPSSISGNNLSSIGNYTKGLSAADADLFTKPELLMKDFTSSTMRNTTNHETFIPTKGNMDITDLHSFKSNILENNMKYPSSSLTNQGTKVNNLKEIVLGKGHEYNAPNELYLNSITNNNYSANSDKYLFEHKDYYGSMPLKTEPMKIENTEPYKQLSINS